MSACQVLHPFVFLEMMEYPGELAHLVDAGAGVYYHNGPVEVVGSGGCQGNGQAPHAHCQAVHIKHGISSCAEDSIDGHIIDGTADHMDIKS